MDNPMRYIDPEGMSLAEFEIQRKTGEITKVNDNQYYKTESGEVKALAEGESTEGKTMVDKITNSEGESEHFTAGSIKESSEDNKVISKFANAEEGKNFYYFVAESSNVEWGAGEVKIAGGQTEVLVGSDHKEGQTSFIGRLVKAFGNDLLWASHSHPVSGGPPSYDVRDKNRNLVGDLNNANTNKLNTNYEVYDVPNRIIYGYNKDTYLRVDGNSSKPPVYDFKRKKR